MFDLQLETISGWIRGRGFSSVAVQLPEGLKIHSSELSDYIYESTGARTVILGYPCYGACDLFVDYKRYAQGLIHFGHSPIPSMGSDPDVLYIEARAEVGIDDALAPVIESLPQKVGLLASVQYVHLLDRAREMIESTGRTAVIGKGNSRIFYPGQVLGCNCSSGLSVQDEVDGFLFIGEGNFHPLAAAFGLKKPMTVLNPITGEVRNLDEIRDRILRRRFAAIQSASNAESFMVIVCGKVGQARPEQADRIEDELRKAGKKVTRLLIDEITPDALMAYRADAFVSTACPRVAMDDEAKYGKPVLTVTEAEIVLGIRSWSDYVFDSI